MTEWNAFAVPSFLAAGVPRGSFDGITLLSLVVVLLAAANVTTIVVLLLYLRKAKQILPSGSRSAEVAARLDDKAFVVLRDEAADINRNLIRLSNLATSASMQTTEFQRGFEQFAFGHWEDQRKLQQKCQQMVQLLIVLRDRMEQLLTGRIPPENVRTLAETCEAETYEVLSQVGIAEIPVQGGLRVDPSLHRVVGTRVDACPKDVILEVVRRGYAAMSEGGETVVLRPCEVIVSGGPPKPEAIVGEGKGVPEDEAADTLRRPLDRVTPAPPGPGDVVEGRSALDVTHGLRGAPGEEAKL